MVFIPQVPLQVASGWPPPEGLGSREVALFPTSLLHLCVLLSASSSHPFRVKGDVGAWLNQSWLDLWFPYILLTFLFKKQKTNKKTIKNLFKYPGLLKFKMVN